MAEGKGKKKGGKLPIIMVAVLVVAGGGFFAMSKGGGKEEKKKEPDIELGAVESLGDEFLVNVGEDGRTFLVCKISVQLRKPDKDNPDDHVSVADPSGDAGGHGAAGDASYSIARNAVLDVLAHRTWEDLTKPDSMKIVRREIAAALNHQLGHHGEEEDTSSKKKKKKKDEEEHGGHEEIDHEWLDELGMDSEEGPVLKVLITDWAYQKY